MKKPTSVPNSADKKGNTLWSIKKRASKLFAVTFANINRFGAKIIEIG